MVMYLPQETSYSIPCGPHRWNFTKQWYTLIHGSGVGMSYVFGFPLYEKASQNCIHVPSWEMESLPGG